MGFLLEGNELTYLAARSGAESMFGLTESLSSMPDDELSSAMSVIEKNLLEKKFIKEDFDGNVAINKELETCVDICAFPEMFLSAQAERTDIGVVAKYYFKKGKNYCRMDIKENNTYDLEVIEPSVIKDEMEGFISLEESSTLCTDSFEISNNDFSKACALIKEGAVKKGEGVFSENGATEDLAIILSESVTTKLSFYSILAIDLNSKEDTSVDIQLITGEKLVVIDRKLKNYEDYAFIHGIDSDEIKNRLNRAYGLLGIE